jgi:hypothetical protein
VLSHSAARGCEGDPLFNQFDCAGQWGGSAGVCNLSCEPIAEDFEMTLLAQKIFRGRSVFGFPILL